MHIGTGVFTWDRGERITDRYGSFFLDSETSLREKGVDCFFFDAAQLSGLAGKRVHIRAEVLVARKSGHIGDLFLGIVPTQPDVGEVVDLGVGTLAPGIAENTFILMPDDGRECFWMDPRKLYRLHDQTVKVHIEPTSEPCSPKPDLISRETLEECEEG